jgi:hypothetical protein
VVFGEIDSMMASAEWFMERQEWQIYTGAAAQAWQDCVALGAGSGNGFRKASDASSILE